MVAESGNGCEILLSLMLGAITAHLTVLAEILLLRSVSWC